MNDTYECAICMEILSKYKLGILECQHIFCIKKFNNMCCAFCQQKIHKIKVCKEPFCRETLKKKYNNKLYEKRKKRLNKN